MSLRGRSIARRAVLVVAIMVIASCRKGGETEHEHEHEHKHHDDHGKGEGAKDGEEVEPLSVTRWSDHHELFVEFPPPRPGSPVTYHAHVTRLDGFKAVTEGRFRVRFKSGPAVVGEAAAEAVKRAGIFVPEGPAPAAAGTYSLEMVYEHGQSTDVFDCGQVTVSDAPPKPPEPEGAEITFLKEAQWKIPFATAWAAERPMAKEIELAATVEPAGTEQLTIGAPTGGRFFHNPKISIAEGLRLKKGDLIGTIAPTVAGDDYSRLTFAVEEARLQKEQAARELSRVEPLVAQGLLPDRRLVEAKNELESASARLRSAEGRIGRVNAPGGAGGLPIKASLEGVVAQVLVPNGEPVEAGAPLVRIGGTDHLWIRARFIARPASSFPDAAPASARLPSGERVDLSASGARFLSAVPAVDAATRLATWIIDVPAARRDAAPEAGSADLKPGASVVVAVRIGAPRTLLAVERDAVVEINTRPFVFVQTDGEHFEKRPVLLGDTDGGFVAVTSGVEPGERVVTRGGFDVHLAAVMGTVESHRH